MKTTMKFFTLFGCFGLIMFSAFLVLSLISDDFDTQSSANFISGIGLILTAVIAMGVLVIVIKKLVKEDTERNFLYYVATYGSPLIFTLLFVIALVAGLDLGYLKEGEEDVLGTIYSASAGMIYSIGFWIIFVILEAIMVAVNLFTNAPIKTNK